MPTAWGWGAYAVAVAATTLACGARDSLGDPPDGVEGARCYPNSTCNAGFTCLSGLCVTYPDGGVVGPHADAGADADSGGDPFAGPAAAFAQAYCKQQLACFGIPGGFLDLSTCVSRTTLDAVDALRAPQTGWTTSLLTDCAQQTASATCSELWLGMKCLQKPGARPNGSSCGRASQCASFACHVAPSSLCGVCVPAQPSGAMCATAADCAYPLRCSGSVCVAPADANAPCAGPLGLCAYGLACRNGVCLPAGTGTTCASSVQDCQTNDFCSVVTETCEKDAFALPGETCGWVNADASKWVDCLASPRACARTDAQLTGPCPTLVADGKACGTTTTICIPPAVCAAGVCTPPSSATCK